MKLIDLRPGPPVVVRSSAGLTGSRAFLVVRSYWKGCSVLVDTRSVSRAWLAGGDNLSICSSRELGSVQSGRIVV